MSCVCCNPCTCPSIDSWTITIEQLGPWTGTRLTPPEAWCPPQGIIDEITGTYVLPKLCTFSENCESLYGLNSNGMDLRIYFGPKGYNPPQAAYCFIRRCTGGYFVDSVTRACSFLPIRSTYSYPSTDCLHTFYVGTQFLGFYFPESSPEKICQNGGTYFHSFDQVLRIDYSTTCTIGPDQFKPFVTFPGRITIEAASGL